MFVHRLDPELARDVDALYRAHARTVARFAAKLAGPTNEVDDVVQEVFVVASERLGRFRGDADVRTWLYAITRNIVRHRRRSAHRARRNLGLARLEPAVGAPTPEDALVRSQAISAVSHAVASLDEKYQTALMLHAVEGLSGAEIAAKTGVEPATVWVRLHRARHLIKAALIKGAIILVLAAAGTAGALELAERLELLRKEPPPPATNGQGRNEVPEMKKLCVGSCLAAVALAAAPLAAVAEEPRSAPPAKVEEKKPEVVYSARTVIDFSGVKVTGTLVTPEGSYIPVRSRSNFQVMIKVRSDFRPELLKSVDEI